MIRLFLCMVYAIYILYDAVMRSIGRSDVFVDIFIFYMCIRSERDKDFEKVSLLNNGPTVYIIGYYTFIP